jgi:hypothetical protein
MSSWALSLQISSDHQLKYGQFEKRNLMFWDRVEHRITAWNEESIFFNDGYDPWSRVRSRVNPVVGASVRSVG